MTADPSLVAILGMVKKIHEAAAAAIIRTGLPKEFWPDFLPSLQQGADDAQYMLELQLDKVPRRASHEAPWLDDLPETREFNAMVDWHRRQLPAPVAETIETLVGLYGVKP